MTEHPNFRLEHPDIRDRVITVVITIAMVLLMLDGWLRIIGR